MEVSENFSKAISLAMFAPERAEQRIPSSRSITLAKMLMLEPTTSTPLMRETALALGLILPFKP